MRPIYNENQIVKFGYTNWKGEYDIRTVVPMRIYFGQNEYHKTPQWLIEAWDVDKQATRTFAMADTNFAAVKEPNLSTTDQ